MSRILITGGAGFIGSHIAEKFVNDGHDVIIFDNFSAGKRENISGISEKVQVIEGDVRDLDSLMSACKQIDFISHHAAVVSVPASIKNPQETIEVNTKGTLNVLIAAKENSVKKLSFASSSSVYGDTTHLPVNELEPIKGLSPYAVSKATSEYYCQAFSHLFQINIVVFRYFNVFGLRQDASSPYSGVIAKFIDAAKKGEKICIYGDGTQTRDFIPVNKIAEVNSLVLRGDFHGVKIMNIGGGGKITISELAEIIEGIYGSSAQKEYLPARDGDIKHSYADIEEAKKILNFDPSYIMEKELKKI